MKKVKEWKYHQEAARDTEVARKRREKIFTAIGNSKRFFSWDYRNINSVTTQLDWNQTLATMIDQANKDFGGTMIITSPEVCLIVDSLMFFNIADDHIADISFYKSGTLNGLDVYVDPYLPGPILMIVKDDFFTIDNPECVFIKIDGLPI